MSSFWEKLNHLVPEPNCKTRGNKIIEWNDERPQPSNSAINAVTTKQVNNAKKEVESQRLPDSRMALESALEIIYENPDLLGAFADFDAFKQAVSARYKTKL